MLILRTMVETSNVDALFKRISSLPKASLHRDAAVHGRLIIRTKYPDIWEQKVSPESRWQTEIKPAIPWAGGGAGFFTGTTFRAISWMANRHFGMIFLKGKWPDFSRVSAVTSQDTGPPKPSDSEEWEKLGMHVVSPAQVDVEIHSSGFMPGAIYVSGPYGYEVGFQTEDMETKAYGTRRKFDPHLGQRHATKPVVFLFLEEHEIDAIVQRLDRLVLEYIRGKQLVAP